MIAHSTGQSPSKAVLHSVVYAYDLPTELIQLCRVDEEERYDEVVGVMVDDGQ